MAATNKEIRTWLENKPEGATHMIVVCDTFDHDDYPVYVMPDQNVKEVEASHNGPNMQRVIEVYSFNHNIESQLNETRAHHYD